MPKRRLTRTYEPNPALQAVYDRFFDEIQVDESWAGQVRELAGQGTVVYVLRNLNFIDFFALDHLTKRYGLPRVQFVNDLGLWVLNPMGKGWLNAVFPRRGVTPADELRDALSSGGSAALFLKRPPGVVDIATGASGGRGLREGDELMRTLFDLQHEHDRPILLLPQVFVWSKRPDTLGTRPLDWVLGPREWPSPVRTVGQFLHNHRHVALRAGEPLNLKQFIDETPSLSDAVRVRRVTYAVLRRVERERRAIVGPAEKPPDRVRHEIVRGPKLRATIDELAGEHPADRAILTGRALRILRKLQATPETATLKGLEVLLDRVFHKIYAGIDFANQDIERLRAASRDGSVVLLPSHKSHVDYLILSYVCNESNLQLPLIAAGENLSFFPLGPILRRGGAFFIRRSFKGDRLYAAVVDAYVRRLIRDGFPIELFLEGGRSRNGKLLPPKYGLLNMVVDAAAATPRPVYFAPVSIGYERLVEAESYQRELAGGEKSQEDATGLLKSTQLLRHRYGRINVQFGRLLTLEDIQHELGIDDEAETDEPTRRALSVRLANRVMDEINSVTAVTPGALTATALLSDAKLLLSDEQLLLRCERFFYVLKTEGARITETLQTRNGTLRHDAIHEALQMFRDARLVETSTQPAKRRDAAVRYSVPDKQRITLDATKNMIVHFFVERGLVATAMVMDRDIGVLRATLIDRVLKLSRLFKFEFRFHADKSFQDIFDETLDTMIASGVLKADGDSIVPGAGRQGWDGLTWTLTYASLLQNFVEGYRVAARGLAALVKGPLSEKDLAKKSLAAGNRMHLAGDIERREAVSKPIVVNAFKALADQGYVSILDDGRYELAPSFRSVGAVKAIESRIAGYLRANARRGEAS